MLCLSKTGLSWQFLVRWAGSQVILGLAIFLTDQHGFSCLTCNCFNLFLAHIAARSYSSVLSIVWDVVRRGETFARRLVSFTFFKCHCVLCASVVDLDLGGGFVFFFVRLTLTAEYVMSSMVVVAFWVLIWWCCVHCNYLRRACEQGPTIFVKMLLISVQERWYYVRHKLNPTVSLLSRLISIQHLRLLLQLTVG